jgi:hypothetical protein
LCSERYLQEWDGAGDKSRFPWTTHHHATDDGFNDGRPLRLDQFCRNDSSNRAIFALAEITSVINQAPEAYAILAAELQRVKKRSPAGTYAACWDRAPTPLRVITETDSFIPSEVTRDTDEDGEWKASHADTGEVEQQGAALEAHITEFRYQRRPDTAAETIQIDLHTELKGDEGSGG